MIGKAGWVERGVQRVKRLLLLRRLIQCGTNECKFKLTCYWGHSRYEWSCMAVNARSEAAIAYVHFK